MKRSELILKLALEEKLVTDADDKSLCAKKTVSCESNRAKCSENEDIISKKKILSENNFNSLVGTERHYMPCEAELTEEEYISTRTSSKSDSSLYSSSGERSENSPIISGTESDGSSIVQPEYFEGLNFNESEEDENTRIRVDEYFSPSENYAISIVQPLFEIIPSLETDPICDLGQSHKMSLDGYQEDAQLAGPSKQICNNSNQNANSLEKQFKCSDENCSPSTYEETSKQRYIKKESARERPTICPLCYEDVITHFPRHLFRHHKNNEQVKEIKKLKAGSKERLTMIATLRKQGYFHMNIEKNILNPIRTSKDVNSEYFVCSYCLGHYTKHLLYKHVKGCKLKPENISQAGKRCLSNSQTFLASETSKNQMFLNSSRIKSEVFGIMRADDISMLAKTDPLICLYGEYLLARHKRQQMAVVISNKIREMARMFKEIRGMNQDVTGFFDLLKPEMFETFIYAAKIISGYDVHEKTFKAASLAMHMGTNISQICDVAYKAVLEKRNIPNMRWDNREKKLQEIKDLKKLTKGHWCNQVSSLALKSLQEKRWTKPTKLPLGEDIVDFQKYLNETAESAHNKLTEKIDVNGNYKQLAECVLSLTVMFNRKRVGEVQYLTIETYNNNLSNGEQTIFSESLTTAEKILSKHFKRIITGGKGSKPVPILFSKQIQKYITCLLNIRDTTDLVPKSNPYLFANPGSKDKWMAGANIIRRLAESSGAKEPTLLTSTRFRKHIATTLQLMSMQDDEMEQIATFMGHTKKTHAEFYRLPQDIYQTAKVAKVLLLLEKGRGIEFKGKSLNEIDIGTDVFLCSDSEEDITEIQEPEGNNSDNICVDLGGTSNTIRPKTSIKKSSRVRWTIEEKEIVLKYFKEHIKKKITPKKYECEEFLNAHEKKILEKNWVKIKSFIYNAFRKK